MLQANRVIKAAAVTTSVLLVAGFVAYRAGAWNSVASDQPVLSGNLDLADTSATANSASNTPEPSGSSEQNPAMFSSSKSAILIVPAPKEAFMGGSKSLAPVVPPAPPSHDAQSPPRP